MEDKKFEGILATAGEVNKNGRLYSPGLFKKALARYSESVNINSSRHASMSCTSPAAKLNLKSEKLIGSFCIDPEGRVFNHEPGDCTVCGEYGEPDVTVGSADIRYKKIDFKSNRFDRFRDAVNMKSYLPIPDWARNTDPESEDVDKVQETATARKKDGLCISCGHSGEWVAMALVCPNGHGTILG